MGGKVGNSNKCFVQGCNEPGEMFVPEAISFAIGVSRDELGGWAYKRDAMSYRFSCFKHSGYDMQQRIDRLEQETIIMLAEALEGE